MLIALWCLRVNSPQMWGLKYETKKQKNKKKNKKQNFLIELHQVGHLKYIKIFFIPNHPQLQFLVNYVSPKI